MNKEEAKKRADEWLEEYAFQVPYDGSNVFYTPEKLKYCQAAIDFMLTLLSDLPESKGSETDMGTKIEPEFPSWTETESGVTEKSNPQYGIYHFLKHWYYRVVAPCLKSDGWIPVSERLPKPIMRNGYFGFRFLYYTEDQRRALYYENFMWGNKDAANKSLKIFLDQSKIANWQPLPAVPQERGETK